MKHGSRETGAASFDWEALKRQTALLGAQTLTDLELDAIFAARAGTLAQVEKRLETTGTPMLSFRHGDTSFSVDLACVARVLRPRKLTRIPQAPAHLDRVLYEGGRIVCTLNPSALFGRATPEQPLEPIVLLDVGGDLLGVRASRLERLRPIDTGVLGPPSLALPAHARTCVLGIAEDMTVVLDGPALVRLLGTHPTES